MRRPVWILVVLLVLGLWLWTQQRASSPDPSDVPAGAARPVPSLPTAPAVDSASLPAFLPAEAHAVLRRIAQDGPFEYRQDGGVFQNRERRLPTQPRGYYREYTVATPGSRDRGARRIITGGEPPREYWYTDDHYRSFRRFQVAASGATP